MKNKNDNEINQQKWNRNQSTKKLAIEMKTNKAK
jgi:hypothetical protein